MSTPAAGTLARDAGTLTLGGETEVCRLGFGAMRITGEGIWGPPANPDGARAVLRRALELGVNFIDTAGSYGPEVSENLIREALSPYPEDLTIATKGGFLRDGPNQWRPDGRPEQLREACEGSLRRLGLETIDLYQLHVPDSNVPYAESVGALAELREQGKVRHVGVSNVNLEQLEQALAIVPVVSVQNCYSISDRHSEDVLRACEQRDMAFIPWFPLGAGRLTRPGGPLDRIAAAHDASAVQMAIAWLLAHAPWTLPIPGTSSIEHLEENVAAAQLKLSPQELAALEG